MVQRYMPSGSMAEAIDGTFVSFIAYEQLTINLAETLDAAAEYFKQVESGQLSATDAAAALRVNSRLG